MRYFVDKEFVEDGKTIDLISIGIVAEDGRELYLQSAEFDDEEASPWVKENVLPHLVSCPELSYERHFFLGGQCLAGSLGKIDCPWRSRAQIASEIIAFMDIEKYGHPELWGYYSAYDHVAFCQLFGTMMDLPKGYPMLTYDLRQWLDMHGMQDVRQPDDSVHNALIDARWVAETYKRLVK
jgi:hypothetical protein